MGLAACTGPCHLPVPQAVSPSRSALCVSGPGLRQGAVQGLCTLQAARATGTAVRSAPACVSFSGTSSSFISAWPMMPSSSAMTAIVLPLAMAALAMEDAFS